MTELEFADFFNLHWANVYGLALKLCRDESSAKDICQNIFSSIWTRGLSFGNEKEATSYLAKSTKYQVLNYFRDKKPSEELLEEHFQNGSEQLRYNPETVLFQKELAEQFELQINALQEPSKTIFLLSREQNLSYKEIALAQGIAIKTVEKHISVALRQLRSLLPSL